MSRTKQNNTYINSIITFVGFIIVFIFLLLVIPMFKKTFNIYKISSIIDCSGNWNDWSNCNLDTNQIKRDFNVIIKPLNGGINCPVPQIITCPIDCSWNWYDWSDCDQNTGQKTRTIQINEKIKRTINQFKSGADCPGPETIKCPVDCSGYWNNWSDCISNSGTKTRSFNIIKPALNNGFCPGTETITCPVDCLGNWSICDINTNTKTFNITKRALNKGICPGPEPVICPVDCIWTTWKPWSICNPNTGMKTREIKMIKDQLNGGANCPGVLTTTCPVDCSWNWNNWDSCNINTGQRTRTINKIIEPLYDGIPCPQSETINCRVDCSWNWNNWNSCNIITGQRTRTINNINILYNGGTDCPASQTVNCPVDCSWNWSNWNSCNIITGQRTRTIKRIIEPLYDGIPCPQSETSETINCRVNCSWNWNNWDSCNINTGQRTRTINRIIEPQYDGIPCPQSETINCPVDCSWNWSNWSNWSSCEINGKITRTINRIIEPRNKGISCPELEPEFITCNPVDCSWNSLNPWSDWSDCNTITSKKTRTINMIIETQHNGRTCPAPQTVNCPIDCSWNSSNAWNDWSTSICAITGQFSRTIKWTIEPKYDGRNCPEPQTVVCPLITNISGTRITTGDITTDNSRDKFMIFKTGTNTFIIKNGGITCDILMIGGGGAGGYFSGGGGAGACIVAIGHNLPGGNCTVIVGAGAHNSGNGYISSISVDANTLYRANGGGCGAYEKDGIIGGCGGGCCIRDGRSPDFRTYGGEATTDNIVNGVNGISPSIGATYAVLGNKGGDQNDFTNNHSSFSAAGGGGIGSAAPNHKIDILEAGPGGDGLNEVRINDISYNFKSYFANDNPFGHNDNGYIGGGGGGASFFSLTQAPGGIGGGGKGTSNLYVNYSWRESLKDFYSLNPNNPTTGPTSGAMNTGSGGGGGGFYSRSGDSSGGSGIVIIRYRT